MTKRLSDYRGIAIKQTDDILISFPKLIDKNNFERVLEIGMFSGAFSLFITDQMSSDVDYLGYEIDPKVVNPKAQHLNHKTVDVFTDLDFISDYITQPGQTLVLCDGGNKLKEMEHLAPLIKSNDIIMCHDYVNDTKDNHKEYYKATGLNPSGQSMWETSKTMLQPLIDANNLIEYKEVDFGQSCWSCLIKA